MESCSTELKVFTSLIYGVRCGGNGIVSAMVQLDKSRECVTCLLGFIRPRNMYGHIKACNESGDDILEGQYY